VVCRWHCKQWCVINITIRDVYYDILLCTVLFLVWKLLHQLCFVYKYPRRHMKCVSGVNGGKRVKRLACLLGCLDAVWRSSWERRDLFQWPDDPHYLSRGAAVIRCEYGLTCVRRPYQRTRGDIRNLRTVGLTMYPICHRNWEQAE
jgi:hypothetical protein